MSVWFPPWFTMRVNHGGTELKLPQLLYAGGAVLISKSEEIDRMVGHLYDVFRRRKLKVNVRKARFFIL